MKLALLLLLLTSGVDTLVRTNIDRLSFRAPKEWTVSEEDNGKTWTSPDEDAEFAVSVFAVDPQRPAKSCVKQMVEAVGGEGFEKTTIAGKPASKLVSTDYLGEAEQVELPDGGKAAGKVPQSDENKVTTTTILGCDGRTKWVLTYTTKTSEAPRYGPILKRILDSLKYTK